MKAACLGDDDQACGLAAGVAGQRGERTRPTTHAPRLTRGACVVRRVRSPRRPPRAAVKTDRVTGIPPSFMRLHPFRLFMVAFFQVPQSSEPSGLTQAETLPGKPVVG